MKVHGYYDDEARSISMLGLQELHPSEQVLYVMYAKERIAAFFGGAHNYPHLTEFLRHELDDPLLLARYDVEFDCISIDKFVPDLQCYFKLFNLVDEYGRGRRLLWGEERHLVKMMRDGDMRQPDYINKHRAKVDATKEANAKKRTEMVLEAVDKLSSKAMKQFIDVHRAIHTGERITAHGADLKTMEIMAEASRTAPMVPTGKAFNEGMHPLGYSRDPR